jgi:hypothetical protein
MNPTVECFADRHTAEQVSFRLKKRARETGETTDQDGQYSYTQFALSRNNGRNSSGFAQNRDTEYVLRVRNAPYVDTDRRTRVARRTFTIEVVDGRTGKITDFNLGHFLYRTNFWPTKSRMARIAASQLQFTQLGGGDSQRYTLAFRNLDSSWIKRRNHK